MTLLGPSLFTVVVTIREAFMNLLLLALVLALLAYLLRALLRPERF